MAAIDLSAEQVPTFCRICEPLCGMIATVEDGRLVTLRPDRDHPLSAGFACPKGIAFTEVHNDPDRIVAPMRRGPDGEFEPVDWDEAMSDIAARLAAIHRKHGSGAVGWYFGNPGAFSYSHTLWINVLLWGLGPKSHLFTAGSQDINNRIVASQLLYGSPLALPIPDIPRTDLLVVIGANPVVSHGSLLTLPRIRDRMHDVVKRGGRVLVIDPRKTETAAQFEWLGITPDSDAHLLLALLNVMLTGGGVDRSRIMRIADGLEWLETLVAPFTPENTQPHTGIAPEVVRTLAHDLVTTPRAVVYGRVGTSVGRAGTLTTYLLDVVNLVAGNLDHVGGSMFGTYGLPAERGLMMCFAGLMRWVYRTKRSRVGGFPSVLMTEPAGVMAKEITTAGEGQVRALFVSAGNPVLSVPNGDELRDAMRGLELAVGIDLYITETGALCDYVLPATTMYERDDFPVPFQILQTTPFRQATEAVVQPAGQTRPEWRIIDELSRRLARRTPVLAALQVIRRGLRLAGVELTPRLIADTLIRLAEGGDRFGMRRGGLTFRRLTERHPHGKVLASHLGANALSKVVVYRGGKVRLAHADIEAEVRDLVQSVEPEGFPLRLIGMREVRSENSWMHNSALLMRGRRQVALMHVDDAVDRGLTDGDRIRVRSQHGDLEIAVKLTKDIVAGVVAIPHGWGHDGTAGWRTANNAGGANVNRLMSSEPHDLERLAGMARLTGVPIAVDRV